MSNSLTYDCGCTIAIVLSGTVRTYCAQHGSFGQEVEGETNEEIVDGEDQNPIRGRSK